jgi:hypothetical protein
MNTTAYFHSSDVRVLEGVVLLLSSRGGDELR